MIMYFSGQPKVNRFCHNLLRCMLMSRGNIKSGRILGNNRMDHGGYLPSHPEHTAKDWQQSMFSAEKKGLTVY